MPEARCFLHPQTTLNTHLQWAWPPIRIVCPKCEEEEESGRE